MTRLVFLDTETTGIHPGRRVWEIAMIRRDENGDREISIYVEVDLSAADPFGLSIGRFYERHPVGQYLSGRIGSESYALKKQVRDPLYAAKLVAQWTHGAHLIGAVPNFDAETLTGLLRDHGLIPAWHYHLCDVENLAVGYLAAKGEPLSPPWDSEVLSAKLGVDPSQYERHTALGDARWARDVYDA
ncbi:MAG: hypothetical protein JWO67_5631, partial [Streptosporangiaceae bacterium]|nr:hypothetical protein [Streptosporangiaceae bacterium]